MWNLEAGQSITVDSGHMVAYDDSVQMSIRKATGGVVGFKGADVMGADGRPDPAKLDLIARLGGDRYVRTRDIFELERP